MPKVRIDETFEMDYEIDDFTDPWTQPDTVILQHGAMHPRIFWYAWIPTLARHFRVIRPHFRGYFDSAFKAPPGYRWTMDGFVSDMKNFLDGLGLDRVHFVGESSGGIIGYSFAYHHPERLKTLTVCTIGPTLIDINRILGRYIPDIMKSNGVSAFAEHLISDLWQEGTITDPAQREWMYNLERTCPREATIGISEADQIDMNVENFLAKINVPTLLLIGEKHNRIITVQELERIRDLMPRAKLVVIRRTAGMVQWKMPERSAREVVRFIKEQSST